jgi:hypothetical protein
MLRGTDVFSPFRKMLAVLTVLIITMGSSVRPALRRLRLNYDAY